jgi:hypothetical protein
MVLARAPESYTPARESMTSLASFEKRNGSIIPSMLMAHPAEHAPRSKPGVPTMAARPTASRLPPELLHDRHHRSQTLQVRHLSTRVRGTRGLTTSSH